MSEYDVYFRAFCSYLGGGKCLNLAKEVEKGKLSKEKFYEIVLEEFGTTKVEQAHKYAMGVVEASKTGSKKSEEEIKSEEKKEENSESSCPDCTYTQEELNEVKKRQELKVKSSLTNICLACVAAMTLALSKVMQDWYQKDDRKKFEDIAKKVVEGEITVEDAIVEMLKLPGAPEALDRILTDFNAVMEKAFERASTESEEFRRWMEEKQKAVEAV